MDIGYNPFPEWISVYSRESSYKHRVEKYVRERVTHNLSSDEFVCSECLHSVYMYDSELPRYCPNCGRKVV